MKPKIIQSWEPTYSLEGRKDQSRPPSSIGAAKCIKHIAKTIQTSSKKTRQQKISPLPIVYGALINQLASGHSPLHHHLFKSKRRLDPTCPFCPGRDTTLHFFDFCPKHRVARQFLRLQAKRDKIKFQWNKPHLLLQAPKAGKAVAEFLKATNRFTYL
ncbi:hypothetical protein PCASD_03569 [Puccinia coronata f. sp. avenae]|uniref:Reverse transcriptase zinc-binding domain-containing protein n=1 Tax=Puccinia coronata f. sp. avenae TaxID=200324 RepID=A0A2N5VDL0_9BASI|nr:hypothetical protein PCASD_12544 [Puccinia coronata f. sp. avenae]PLW48085.1 hypothetical protein PCASD_03569 [Puccinia coronata f. sp. avenae]